MLYVSPCVASVVVEACASRSVVMIAGACPASATVITSVPSVTHSAEVAVVACAEVASVIP